MASSVQYRIIDLQGATRPVNRRLELLRAEVPSGPYLSPFAVVRYAYNGEEQSKGLRLDLDKGVFLDHFEDREQELYLQSQAPAVVSAISSVLRDQLLNQLPMPGNRSRALSRQSRGPRDSPRSDPQRIFICYEGSEDAEWARLFQEYLHKNLTQRVAEWHVVSMNVASMPDQLADWRDHLAALIASSAVIIILINESALIRSAPSRMLQKSINDAHAQGAEVVPVFTSPITSRSSFRRAAAIFKGKPHILQKDDERQASQVLHDLQERIEEALGSERYVPPR